MIRRTLLVLIRAYQLSFAFLGRGSCRYYPSCSEYAVQQFENNALLPALFSSSKRILTCNQMFPGGIDYVVVAKLRKNPKSLTIDRVKYWLVPRADNRYSLIKNFSYKG